MSLRKPMAALASVVLITGCYRYDYYYLLPNLPNDVVVLQTGDPDMGMFYVGKPIPLRFSVMLDGEQFLFSVAQGGTPHMRLEEPPDRKYLLLPSSCFTSMKLSDSVWLIRYGCEARLPPGRPPEEARLRILVSQRGALDRTYEIPFVVAKAGRYTLIDSI